MPKAKKAGRKKKFDYSQDRKKAKKKFTKKNNPRIDNSQIRNAWDQRKSVARNLQDMGLAFDPNRCLPIKKPHSDGARSAPPIVTKPYVLDQLMEEGSRPEKDTKTLSSNIIEFVQHMIREHGEDHKAMARDEKNYYQDTPKQIKRKIELYKRFHPDQYSTFISSLAAPEQMVQ
ncbi:uncharacterized protein V6R79_018898 [Siganus canaliculatus]